MRPIRATMTGSRRPSPAGSISHRLSEHAVAEQVAAVESTLARVAHDDAADHGAAEVVAVLGDGQRQPASGRSRRLGLKQWKPSITVPAEVQPARAGAARRRSPPRLPWPTSPIHRSPVGPVEADAPRVAQAGQPDLGLRAPDVDERVVRRDRRTALAVRRARRRRCAGSWPAACRAAGRCPAGRRRSRRRRVAM